MDLGISLIRLVTIASWQLKLDTPRSLVFEISTKSLSQPTLKP